MTSDMPYILSEQQAQEIKSVRRAANIAGSFPAFSLAIMLLCSFFIPLLLISAGLLNPWEEMYGLQPWLYELLNLLLYALSLLPTALIGWLLRQPFPFIKRCNAPLHAGTAFPAICMGLGVCITANIIANFVYIFFLGMGIDTSPDTTTVLSIPCFLISLLSTAVLPALLEEMIFRGYMLRALRPYGETTAIWVTALLFSLLHGNVLQIPFSFVLGWLFGYLTVRTNSIWPAVMVHFMNNAYATCQQYGALFVGQGQGEFIFSAVAQALMILLGLIGVWYLRTKTDFLRSPSNGPWYTLSSTKRAKVILTSPVMILSFVLLFAYIVYVACVTWKPFDFSELEQAEMAARLLRQVTV